MNTRRPTTTCRQRLARWWARWRLAALLAVVAAALALLYLDARQLSH